MKMLKLVSLGAACLGFVVIGGYVGTAWLTERYTRAAFENSEAAWKERRAHFDPQIKADMELLTEQPIFVDLARIRNAEPLIRAHMTWDGDKTGSAPEGLALEEETLNKAFFEKHKTKFDLESWQSIIGDSDLDRLKLSWLDELITYDHINLASHPSHQLAISSVEKMNGLDRIGAAASLSLPNYVLWQALATYRFAQLQKSGQLEKAAELYRHLAYLSFSSNTLIGSVVAVSMLDREHVFSAALGSYPIATVEKNRSRALKALSWFWSDVYHRNFLANHSQGLEEFFTRETGACGAASEIFSTTSGLASLFEPNAPLEQDFTANFKRARAFESKLLSMCSLEAYAPFMNPIGASADPMFVSNINMLVTDGPLAPFPIPNPVHIPFLRRVVGTILLSAGTPNGFSVYDKNEREPAAE